MHARTDVGKVRQNNEDAIAFDERLGIAVLADGMGGLNAGEVAAGLAVRVAMERLSAELRGGAAPLDVALSAAFREANRHVYDLSSASADLQGMGTTLVAAIAQSDRCVTAHVGDSRAYRFEAEALTRVTTDHSLVNELVVQGVLSADEARASPNRNIITRAIGIEPEVRCDINTVPAAPGTLLLICSDGLTDMLEDTEIARFCARFAMTPDVLIAELIDEANDRGGFDNVSAIVIAW